MTTWTGKAWHIRTEDRGAYKEQGHQSDVQRRSEKKYQRMIPSAVQGVEGAGKET